MVRRMLLALGIAAVLAGAVSLAGSAVVVAPPGYQIIDLGSFGGRDTYGSSARAINDRGQVVGSSGTSNGLSSHAFRWEKGKMTDLGTLGGSYSSASAINERGDVVGVSEPGGKGSSGEWFTARAFLWRDGKMTDLGTLGGGYSDATGINGAGQVVGVSSTAPGPYAPRHAFLWQDGKMTDLGTLGGADGSSFAYGINDRGQVVGETTVGRSSHAFLWADGRMTDLGTLGGSNSSAHAINELGQVVGSSETSAGASHATLWADGRIVDLGTLGGKSSDAAAINDVGQVVGSADITARGQVSRPFLWQSGTMSSLGGSGGGASGINGGGQIVGGSTLWSPGGETPAPRLVDMRPAAGTPLQASRASAVVTATAPVGVDRAASVTLTVRDPRTGKNLTLAPGSTLAGTTLRTQGTAIEARVGTAAWFTATARLPAGQLARGVPYRLALVATGATGKTGELTLGFSATVGAVEPSSGAPTKQHVVAAVPSGKGGKLTPLNARTLAPVKPGWSHAWPQWQELPAALSPAGSGVAIGTVNKAGDPQVVVLDASTGRTLDSDLVSGSDRGLYWLSGDGTRGSRVPLLIAVGSGTGSMVSGDEFQVVGEGGSTVYNAELPPTAALRDGLVLAPGATPNLLFVWPTETYFERPDIELPKMPAQAPFQVVADVLRDRLYVVSSAGTVATIDKASSAKPGFAYHAVKLGGGHFDAAWAGSGKIAIWGEGGLGTIDVRTWKTHAIAPGVTGALATRYGIAAWTKTPDGLAVHTPNGGRRFQLLQGQQITAARAVGPYLYADTAFRARYAIDLRTGKATGPLPTTANIVTPTLVTIP